LGRPVVAQDAWAGFSQHFSPTSRQGESTTEKLTPFFDKPTAGKDGVAVDTENVRVEGKE